MKKIKKIGLGLMVVFVVVGLVGYLMKSKNKETIVDLGDGWKSYSHEELGLKVKIPEDAEIEYKVEGDKKCCPTARFSKGPISILRTGLYSYDSEKAYQKRLSENRERVSDESGVWEDFESGRSRHIYREVLIDGESAFFSFKEYDITKRDKRRHRFIIDSVTIPSKTGVFLLFFNTSESEGQKCFYEVYPDLDTDDFSNENIERKLQEHIKIIKSLIVSIDKV